MSYPVDPMGSPFRRDMDSRTSYGRSSGTPASGFRSQSWSRTSPASAMTTSFKRSVNTPVARTYGSRVMSSTDSVDYGHSVTLNGDYKRSNEKEQLQGLNDRFAGFIDKVHYLEQQNQQIEAEIQALRQKQVSQSQLGDHYDRELQELRSVLEQIHNEKAQIQLDTDHVEEDIQRMQDRIHEEARIREETEAIIRALKKDMNNSELMKTDLEKKVQSLQDEIAFIQNNHEEEVSEILAQVQASHVTVDRKEFQKTDITEALREIRSQLEGHSSQNLQQMEDKFMCRYSKLTEAAEQNKDAIKSARDEIADYRRQLQSKTVELESVRGTRESLERQLNDIEDRHNSDLESLQETIHQLDDELKGTKWEMARHLREYQDLLNVKMALDIEIAAYRKLLEGEETYFGASPYRQTSRMFKSDPPRLKIQHKFVDEIIEETKVEEDSSDLDESLAEIAQEMSAKLGDGQQDEEEGAGEEGEDGGEEGEAVAPEDTEEEGSDEKGEGESREEEEEDKDGEEGDDGQGEEDNAEEEEGVEETALSAKAPESKASREEKKTREGSGTSEEAEEEEGSDEAGSDKGSKDGDEKDEGKEKTGKDAEVEREKDDKKKTPVTKKGDSKSDPPKPESPESDSPKASSPKAQTPKEAEDKADKKGVATEEKKDAKKDEAKKETDAKDAIVNGVDTSPVNDDPDQMAAITKTAKTLAASEDEAKQVTDAETVKEAEESVREKLVTAKKTEKQTVQVSKTATHTE